MRTVCCIPKATSTHPEYLLCFHCKHGYGNASQGYVVRMLPGMSCFLYRGLWIFKSYKAVNTDCLLESRQLNFLNVNWNSSKNEAYGISCFNTLKAEEKLSIWLNFVLGRLYSDEILITLRWRSLGGNFELFCLQGCNEKLAAEREIWVTTKHLLYGRRNPRTTLMEMVRFGTFPHA